MAQSTPSKEFESFCKNEFAKGAKHSRMRIDPPLVLYQQYSILKEHLFTPNFIKTFGFPQGLRIPNNSLSMKSLGVLALELAPNFSIRKKGKKNN